MTIEEGLRLKALSDARVAGLIGDRWGVMLDAPPCVTVQQVSGVPDVSHSGDSGAEACRYQLAMHTNCVYDAVKLMAYLKALFSGFRGNLGASGEGPAVTVRIANATHHGKQTGVNLFYSTIDLLIWWVRDVAA